MRPRSAGSTRTTAPSSGWPTRSSPTLIAWAVPTSMWSPTARSVRRWYGSAWTEAALNMKIPPSYRRAIVSRLKIMASLDIAERRKPQDGKIKFKVGEREIELRVATVPTSGVANEDVVMRILANSEALPLDKMSFSDRNLRELRKIAEKPYGIILCVGPT